MTTHVDTVDNVKHNNTISFFMLAHKQPKAVEFSLKSIRKYYPDNKIIVFENGSHVLEKLVTVFDVEYIHQERNYMKMKHKYAAMYSKNDFFLFFEQHKQVCERCDTKWVVFLEPDVIFRGRIEYFPNESAGSHLHVFNTFHKEIQNNLQSQSKIFGCAGGFIFNRLDMLYCMNNNPYESINEIVQIHEDEEIGFRSELQCRDACLSFILYKNGFSIEDWSEYCEIHETKDMYRLTFAPIVHGFKYFYD